MSETLLHGCVVRYLNRGILLLGTSGSGKSEVTLRLVDDGGQLVADDQVLIRRDEDRLIASAPQEIRGLIEVRGIGIVRLPYLEEYPIDLVVQLVRHYGENERLPIQRTFEILGKHVPLFFLNLMYPGVSARLKVMLGVFGTRLEKEELLTLLPVEAKAQ